MHIDLKAREKIVQTLAKKIGARLRQRRENLGLSQGEIADRMSVALTTVHRVETGANSPLYETVLKYCKAVEWPLAALEDVSIKAEKPPTFRDVAARLITIVEKIEKQPFLAEILDFDETEMKKLRAAMQAIKTPLPQLLDERKKEQK